MRKIFIDLWKDIINDKVCIDDVIRECKTPTANRNIFDLIVLLIKSGVSSEVIDDIIDYHFGYNYSTIDSFNDIPICMANMMEIAKCIHSSKNDYSSIANWLFIQSIRPFPFEFIPKFKDIVTIKLNYENAGHVYEDNLYFMEQSMVYNLVDIDFIKYIFDHHPKRYGNKPRIDALKVSIQCSSHHNEHEKDIIIDMLVRSYNKHLLINS